MPMTKIISVAAMLTTVWGIAIAQEHVVEPTAFESFVARASVVLEIDEAVGSITSADAELEGALLVVGQARSSRRRNLRARLRACPATGNAGHDRL
jgi:hypothetical protein